MSDGQQGRARLLDPAAAFASLTAALWNEREAIDQVLFKVVQERLLLEAPALRWLPRADEELAGAIRAMRVCAQDRATHVAHIAAGLGLPARCTLAALITHAPEPWPAVLSDHRTALRVLLRDLVTAASATRRQLRRSAADVRESLDEVRAVEGMSSALDQFRAIDRELSVTAVDVTHVHALRTASGLVDKSLAEFLG
jgi:hypothetical protein